MVPDAVTAMDRASSDDAEPNVFAQRTLPDASTETTNASKLPTAATGPAPKSMSPSNVPHTTAPPPAVPATPYADCCFAPPKAIAQVDGHAAAVPSQSSSSGAAQSSTAGRI